MTASIPDLLLALPGWAALLAVFLLPALESSAFLGFLFPGEIAVILGGVAAAAGRMPLPVMIVAAILGAVIGDSIGYAIGKRWGHQMLHGTIGRLPLVRHELERHLESAKAFVRKRGPHAVFIGRFTAALRVLVPGLSGMAGLPYPTFLLYNVLGAVVWGTTFVVLGYFARNAWDRVAKDASHAGLALFAVIALGLITATVLKRRRERELDRER
jgi:undecaprenyl-diphosphatase